jgi:hypothetical protein
MQSDPWAWAITILKKSGFPDEKRLAATIRREAEGNSTLTIPSLVGGYLADVFDGSIDRRGRPKYGSKKTATAVTADIILIERFFELKRSLGTSTAAYVALGKEQDPPVTYETAKQRYNRAKSRENARIPDRDKP